MESTSADLLARELLEHCLAETPWPERLLNDLLAGDSDHALFRIVVERLGDLFEPRLCLVYADLFAEVIGKRVPDLHAEHVAARYRRIRKPCPFEGDPASIRNVFVLSRVTLGADVAVTSVLLDAAKKRFENAAIWFVGPRKSWELFRADARLKHVPIAYGRRGSLEDRLSILPELRATVMEHSSIVIDPDSRLTQLGLLPICPEKDYHFFESRAYGGDSDETLSRLASRWAAETFDGVEARPYIQTGLEAKAFRTTISLGVGENPAKRVDDQFEEMLLKFAPRPVLIDKGAGGEEAERVERAVSKAGEGIEVWDGSFAGFAEHIARSGLYIGYDSAGGHVAAACSVPLISIFAGYASKRMFQRWRPSGQGAIHVLDAGRIDRGELVSRVEALLRDLPA